MAGSLAASPFTAATRAISAAATRNIRMTVVISLIAIAGSFASAAAIQMRLDRTRALDQAASFEARRAHELSGELAAALSRYAALGKAFANAGSPDATAALSDAGGAALKNIVVLDSDGELLSEMKSAPGFLPLGPSVLQRAHAGRAVLASRDGKGFTIIFPSGDQLVAVQLDPRMLLGAASLENAAIATDDGRVLALGANWNAPPPQGALQVSGLERAVREIDSGAGRRIVSVAAVDSWPLTVATSVRAGAALDAWYGSLPLYFFFIFGPALAGAGLAVVFVREFERRAKTQEAMKTLASTKPGDRRLYVRLADAERRAAEAERSKSEFIAHMSHELRTPLNAIIGFSEVIEQELFGEAGHPKYSEYARDIASAGRNLHGKISDILDFANLEAGRHPLRLASVDAAAIARETIDEIAGRAFSRQIRLRVALPQSAFAMADALGVKRVLANLLANALQFTPEKGSVRIELRHEDDAIVIAIRDSGAGFAESEKARAGEPFARFERPGMTTGVGLGLAIASVLARRMGGSLRMGDGEGGVAELRLRRA
ncbi:MAG TPA: HAMP domain-containing sensor histidine kinase [Rhizomicrobium sp.]|nr:HAMP domain-containing sensor histidine kinase [Rhizomicrobium sp.]